LLDVGGTSCTLATVLIYHICGVLASIRLFIVILTVHLLKILSDHERSGYRNKRKGELAPSNPIYGSLPI